MKKIYLICFLIFCNAAVFSQTLYDSYSDGDYTAAPVWAGTAAWGIVLNSDVAAGAPGSNTLRLAAAAVSTTDYLSSQVGTWGVSQEWGFFIGRRAQAPSAVNQSYVWLYANENTLTSATVDGYRIAFGNDATADVIRLEYIVNGAVSATVITSTGGTTAGITDFGFLVRVTRSATGAWQVFTSTLPVASGTGAIATDIPNAVNASISQGTAIENSLVPATNGYIGVAALHSTGANAIIGAEFDQIYFTQVAGGTPTINVAPASLTGFSSFPGVPSAPPQTYTVDGSNLTTDIVIAPPVGFEIALAAGGPYVANPATIDLTPVAGTVPVTTIYVQMNSGALGFNTGDITHTSTGATQRDVAVSGTVLANEPATQGAITFGAITNSTIEVNFSAGAGPSQLLVVRALLPVANHPVDGTTYMASTIFGAGDNLGGNTYAVYAGPSGGTVTVTGLIAGTNYHFAVYEYDDEGIPGSENYLISPLSVGDTSTTLAVNIYVWVGLTGDSWTNPINWLPSRLFPATNDSLFFLDGSTQTVIDVPNETIGYLSVSLGTDVTLQAAVNATGLTIGNSTGVDLEVQNGSSLNITGANAYTIRMITGAVAVIDGGMTFTGGAHKITAADAAGVNFGTGAVFTAGAGFSSNPFGTGGTANSVVFTTGSTYIQQAGSNPFVLGQPASLVVFNTGSLFRMEANLTPSVSGRRYANFELDFPTAAITATGGALLTMDNLTVTNGTINFGMTTAGFDLNGNISVAAGAALNFSPASASSLRFVGTTLQTIDNLGTLGFTANQNVTINNSTGVTLNTPVSLLGTLTFTSGTVNTTATNLLTMGAGSAVAGASNASFVNGPVKKIGNTPFIFPVGKANSLVPIGVSNFAGASAPTDEFTAEYIRASAAALGPVTAPLIDHVSYCEYWTLNVNNGTPTVDLTLFWTANNTCGGGPYVTNLAELEIAHFNNTSWDASSTGFSATNGTPLAGDITWPGVSTFSPFSLASSTLGDNPLPITINYFNGTKNNGNHLLNWKVTCVSTPSATIELERSTDGRSYSSIYSIFATAVRCQQPFDHNDNAPAKGINYYRLKMTDADGKVTYSSIVSLIHATKGIDVLDIAPNPIVNGSFNIKISSAEKTQMDLVIFDMQGRILQKRSVSLIAGFNTIPMNVQNLAAGTYQLFGNTVDGRTRVLRFVIQ